jgi:phosphoenolpyruvate-protein phosphotransferase (PTS system enzyme I)
VDFSTGIILAKRLDEVRERLLSGLRRLGAEVVERVAKEEGADDLELSIGTMIELPRACFVANRIAAHADFFSIGTNDLIQYTLAVDRGNERVANLYTAANPSVLQLIKNVIRAGKRFRIDTSICGEIAGDTLYTMLLIGFGLRTLSLVPSQIPHVKRVIRSVDIGTCERLARKVGSFDSERQVLKCLREELQKVSPELSGGWSADS